MPVNNYKCRNKECAFEFSTYFAPRNPTSQLDAVGCPKCRKTLADKIKEKTDANL